MVSGISGERHGEEGQDRFITPFQREETEMRKWLITCACILAVWLTGSEGWSAPVPVFVSPGPAINAPMDTDAEGSTYGFKSLQTGSWTFDGDSASIDNTPGAVIRLLPTLENNAASGPG